MSRARAVELGRRLRDAAGLGAWTPGRRRPVVRCPHPQRPTTRPAPSTSRPGTARAGLDDAARQLNRITLGIPCAGSELARGLEVGVRDDVERPRDARGVPARGLRHPPQGAHRRDRHAGLARRARRRDGLARPLEDPSADQARCSGRVDRRPTSTRSSSRRASSASTGSSSSAAVDAPRSRRASTRGWRCSRGSRPTSSGSTSDCRSARPAATLTSLPLRDLRERLAGPGEPARPDRGAAAGHDGILDELRAAGLGPVVDDLAARRDPHRPGHGRGRARLVGLARSGDHRARPRLRRPRRRAACAATSPSSPRPTGPTWRPRVDRVRAAVAAQRPRGRSPTTPRTRRSCVPRPARPAVTGRCATSCRRRRRRSPRSSRAGR